MLQRGQLLRVADNSGVRVVRCLRVFRRKVLEVGGLLSVFVKTKKAVRKTVKKNILYAVVLKTRKKVWRTFGNYTYQFDRTVIGVVNQESDQFLASKVYAPTVLEMFVVKHLAGWALTRFFRHVI
jgi:ribosomal protein L14